MGRTLKWVEDRRGKNLVSGGHVWLDRITVTMAFDDDANILGVRFDHLEDSGVYPCSGNLGGMIVMTFSGPYRMQRIGWSSAACLPTPAVAMPIADRGISRRSLASR